MEPYGDGADLTKLDEWERQKRALVIQLGMQYKPEQIEQNKQDIIRLH